MRIPLYNKTGTPSTQAKAQQLSPRASAGAFTQQGQAVAQLGQQIAKTGGDVADKMIKFRQQQEKIEFDFAMAEKEAETQRALDEARVAHNEQSMQFIQDNNDTDTTTFRNNFEAFNKEFLSANVETRTDLTDKQKQAVRTGLNAQFIAKSNVGAKNAFDRATVIRGQSARESISNMLQDASSYPEGHPERQRLETEIEQRIITAERDGLNTGYTVQGVKVSFERLDIDAQIRGATSFDQLDMINESLDKSSLGQQARTTMRNMIKARRSELRNDIYQSNLAAIESLEVDFDDEVGLGEAIINGTRVQGVDENGDTVVIDTSGLKESTRISIRDSMLPKKFKDLEDTVGQAAVNDLVSSAETGSSIIDTLEYASSFYSEKTLNATRKSPEQMDELVIEAAQQMADQAAREIASGSPDESRVLSLLNTSEALISQTLGGRTALSRNIETSDDASKISNSIVMSRGGLAKAQKQAAIIDGGVELFKKGRLNINDIGLTNPEKQEVIAKVLSEYDNLEDQINILSDNDAEYEGWTSLLSVAKNRMRDPSVTEFSEEQQQAVQIFTALSLQGRESVYKKHIKEGDRTFWNSWKTLTRVHSPEVALQMIKQQRSDVDVAANFVAVEDQVNLFGEELFEESWFEAGWRLATGGRKTMMPENTQQITSFVRNLTMEYMKFGVDAETALDLAAKDYFDTHVSVGNVMLRQPQGKDFRPNLPEIREVIVNKYLEENPESPFEADDLSIMNLGDSVDLFRLSHSGGLPVTGNMEIFNLLDAQDILDEADKLYKQRKLDETKKAIEENQ